ncbi:unnamed protein product [Mytilus edulis]|uniref:Uncharacterized protein n=1 Tax=Mytilus edulis TaxID=6550 RepID=A0A8S3V2Y8_MYTED|nr:unnamed protein product [Mytilus edulis]
MPEIFGSEQEIYHMQGSLPLLSDKGSVPGPSALHGTTSGMVTQHPFKGIEGASTEYKPQHYTTPATATFAPSYVGTPYVSQGINVSTPLHVAPATSSESYAASLVQSRPALYPHIGSMIQQPPPAFMTPVMTTVASTGPSPMQIDTSRCASRVECYWDYWIGTGNGTDCIQNGVCTYCCQGPDGKPCNARTEKPTNLTNFGQTQNRAYKCSVTGPQNSNTIQDCPPSDRFCLNDVYYDTVRIPTTSSRGDTEVNGTKCLVCIEDQSNSCSSVDYTVCSGERPYCLNEIIYHNGKQTKTLHRCASEVECYWDYWIGTGNGTDCIQNGVCVYCCKGSNGKPCNAMKEKPTSLSNFGQPQNRAYKCAVTGPQNSNKIQDCPPSERFCLNDVYYDTDPNTNNLITRDVRRCASQEQCKGKWLQSKNINACLTGNMTGVDASKTGNRLLCHYCCESNTMTPCNLHPKPDQINLFLQPTSLPTVSSTGT